MSRSAPKSPLATGTWAFDSAVYDTSIRSKNLSVWIVDTANLMKGFSSLRRSLEETPETRQTPEQPPDRLGVFLDQVATAATSEILAGKTDSVLIEVVLPEDVLGAFFAKYFAPKGAKTFPFAWPPASSADHQRYEDDSSVPGKIVFMPLVIGTQNAPTNNFLRNSLAALDDDEMILSRALSLVEPSFPQEQSPASFPTGLAGSFPTWWSLLATATVPEAPRFGPQVYGAVFGSGARTPFFYEWNKRPSQVKIFSADYFRQYRDAKMDWPAERSVYGGSGCPKTTTRNIDTAEPRPRSHAEELVHHHAQELVQQNIFLSEKDALNMAERSLDSFKARVEKYVFANEGTGILRRVDYTKPFDGDCTKTQQKLAGQRDGEPCGSWSQFQMVAAQRRTPVVEQEDHAPPTLVRIPVFTPPEGLTSTLQKHWEKQQRSVPRWASAVALMWMSVGSCAGRGPTMLVRAANDACPNSAQIFASVAGFPTVDWTVLANNVANNAANNAAGKCGSALLALARKGGWEEEARTLARQTAARGAESLAAFRQKARLTNGIMATRGIWSKQLGKAPGVERSLALLATRVARLA